MATDLLESDIENIADLLRKLGDVPPDRVLLKPKPGLSTEADLLRILQQPRKRICEFIDGTLVEVAMGFRESRLAVVIASILNQWVLTHHLGIVTGEQGLMRLSNQRIRVPDVAYISWDRLPGRKIPNEPVPFISPNLVIEILSYSNTEREMEIKREDFFQSGTELIWEVDLNHRNIIVYTSSHIPDLVLTTNDLLTGGTVLPGFTLNIQEFFAELDRNG